VPVQMGDISNGQFAILGFVDHRGCSRVQSFGHLSHSRGTQPVFLSYSLAARFYGLALVQAGAGASRTGFSNSAHVTGPAASSV